MAGTEITSKEELAALLEAYRSARQEIIERIKQRDQLISFYLAAVAALVGLRTFGLPGGIGAVPNYFNLPLSPLTLHPFLAAFFCRMVCQHQVQIGRLGFFCDARLARGSIAGLLGRPYVNWETLTEQDTGRPSSLGNINTAYGLIFLLPSVAATACQLCLLVFSYWPRWQQGVRALEVASETQRWLSLIGCCACIIVSIVLTVTTIQVFATSIRDRRALARERSRLVAVQIPTRNEPRKITLLHALIVTAVLLWKRRG